MRRSIALAMSVVTLSGVALGPAQAECFCICVGTKPDAVCTQAYDRPPICQRICPIPLTQQIATRPVVTAIQPQGVYGPGGVPPGTLPADPNAAAAALASALGAVGSGAPAGSSVEGTQFGIGTSAQIGAIVNPQIGAVATPQIGAVPTGQIGGR